MGTGLRLGWHAFQPGVIFFFGQRTYHRRESGKKQGTLALTQAGTKAIPEAWGGQGGGPIRPSFRYFNEPGKRRGATLKLPERRPVMEPS
jgi:hypothetical protein